MKTKVKVKVLAIACFSLLVLASYSLHSKHENKRNYKEEQNSIKKEENMMKIKKPNRVTYSYEQTINGSIKEIFPLYCPVKELDWCENWNPQVVYSNSGLVEKDCIFITTDDDLEIVWIVTDYNIETGHVEMFYHVPGVLVTKLEIQVEPIAKDRTKAILTYSKTSLSETGDQVIEKSTQENYNIMMDSWEKAMNHYLKTGNMLTGLPNF